MYIYYHYHCKNCIGIRRGKSVQFVYTEASELHSCYYFIALEIKSWEFFSLLSNKLRTPQLTFHRTSPKIKDRIPLSPPHASYWKLAFKSKIIKLFLPFVKKAEVQTYTNYYHTISIIRCFKASICLTIVGSTATVGKVLDCDILLNKRNQIKETKSGIF